MGVGGGQSGWRDANGDYAQPEIAAVRSQCATPPSSFSPQCATPFLLLRPLPPPSPFFSSLSASQYNLNLSQVLALRWAVLLLP